jgi:hypothetical protein
VDFTNFNRSIEIEITFSNKILVMFFRDFIFWVDSSVHVSIIVSENFFSVKLDIITSPISSTFNNVEWTITINMTVFWTVFISPRVFTVNNTSVDFTSINSLGSILITIFNKDFKMIRFDVITIVDRTIIVGIIVLHSISSDIIDIFTIPSILTLWAVDWFTIKSWVSFWAVF